MTDIALDETALEAALEAWEHGVGFHWDDVQKAIRAYLRSSPSQVAPANPEQVTDAAEALKPFTAFAEEAVERSDNLWVWKSNIFRDRVCDWFGPSDFGLLIHFSKALDAIGAGGQAVAVKPLEWSTNWGTIKAETPIGHYFIEARRDGSFDCRLENVWKAWASSSDAAKAAAQADYERRIKSAIVGGGL